MLLALTGIASWGMLSAWNLTFPVVSSATISITSALLDKPVVSVSTIITSRLFSSGLHFLDRDIAGRLRDAVSGLLWRPVEDFERVARAGCPLVTGALSSRRDRDEMIDLTNAANMTNTISQMRYSTWCVAFGKAQSHPATPMQTKQAIPVTNVCRPHVFCIGGKRRRRVRHYSYTTQFTSMDRWFRMATIRSVPTG